MLVLATSRKKKKSGRPTLDNSSQETGWFYASAWNSRWQPATQDFPGVTGLLYPLPDNESKKFRLTCAPRGNSPGGISPRGLTAGAASQQRNFRRAGKKTFPLKCPPRQPKQDKSPPSCNLSLKLMRPPHISPRVSRSQTWIVILREIKIPSNNKTWLYFSKSMFT